jgi:hypothetical protein
MPRILHVTILSWLVVATMHVTAQQPGGTAAAAPGWTVTRAMPTRIAPPKILPGTRPNVFGNIQGNALTSTDGPLTDVPIRLRDARFGQIVGTQVTDQSGIFAFPKVDPGSYIVEVMGEDKDSVLAASQVLNVGAGEAVSAVVKLAYKIPAHGIVGNSPPTLGAVMSQAAAAGVLATQVSGAPTCITLQR